MKKSDDLTALYYERRSLSAGQLISRLTFLKSGRALVGSIALHGPGAKEGDATLSPSLTDQGTVTISEIRGPDKLKILKSSWLGGIGMSEAALKAIEKIKVADNQLSASCR